MKTPEIPSSKGAKQATQQEAEAARIKLDAEWREAAQALEEIKEMFFGHQVHP